MSNANQSILGRLHKANHFIRYIPCTHCTVFLYTKHVEISGLQETEAGRNERHFPVGRLTHSDAEGWNCQEVLQPKWGIPHPKIQPADSHCLRQDHQFKSGKWNYHWTILCLKEGTVVVASSSGRKKYSEAKPWGNYSFKVNKLKMGQSVTGTSTLVVTKYI